MNVVKVLSIDGGGIRGIIPALLLSEIERLTGKYIADLFDLIVGTSTGAVLTLGLTKPDDNLSPVYRASDLMRFYEQDGAYIFSKTLWRNLRTAWGLADERYNDARLEEVLEKYFGTTTLKDSLADVVITAYEIERRFPFFFKSRKSKFARNYNFLMKDIVRASTAAPTYFEPKKIPTEDSSEYFSLIDGGVFANNPAMCGYVEALTIFPEAKSVLLVSLGTGHQTRSIMHENAKGWGLAQWAVPILDTVFDGISDTVDYQLKQILDDYNGMQMYFRFQPTLEEVNQSLDDASPENIRKLKLLAETLVRERQRDIQTLSEMLLLFSQPST
ncbi:MAG: patatin-like phospholipase family protein [Candidatus Dojkabacteria bacterium]